MPEPRTTPPLQRGRWSRFLPLAFLLPAAVVILVFRLVPMAAAGVLSLCDASFGTIHAFAGLDPYARLLRDPEFWQSLANTAWFVVGVVPLSVAISLAAALLLRRGIRGLGLYRTVSFLPVVTSLVAISLVWKLVFHERFGPANAALGLVGIAPQAWLEEPTGVFQLLAGSCGVTLPAWAGGPSLALVCVMGVWIWRGIGYNVVIFLAGLHAIPTQAYEAARLDGAGRLAVFRHVTWPLLGPTTFYVVVMATILSFQVFAPVYLMTGPPAGGPLGTTNVLVHYLFEKGFDAGGDMGIASATALVLFGLVFGLTLLQRRLVERRVHYA